MWPIVCHRYERVADSDHATEQWDRIAAEPVGIAAAVPALVVRPHDWRGDSPRRQLVDQLRSDDGVLVYELPFRGRRPRGSENDAVRKRNHAQIPDSHRQIQE